MLPDNTKAIEVTTAIGCRNNCAYCPQEKFINEYLKTSNIRSFDLDTFKKCIDKIPADVWIVFAGMCDPWLNPHCTKMVLYARERGHEIYIDTALVGMKLSDVDAISSIPIKYCGVHLPSADHGHEEIAVDESYLAVLNKMLKSGIKCNYHFHGTAIHPKLAFLKEEACCGWLHTRAGNVQIKGRAFPPRKIKGPIGCIRPNFHTLFPNGDVGLCCMDWGRKHVLGNLLISDYVSIFKSDEYMRVQRGMKDDSVDIICRYCEAYVYPTFANRAHEIWRTLSAQLKHKIKRLIIKKDDPKIR